MKAKPARGKSVREGKKMSKCERDEVRSTGHGAGRNGQGWVVAGETPKLCENITRGKRANKEGDGGTLQSRNYIRGGTPPTDYVCPLSSVRAQNQKVGKGGNGKSTKSKGGGVFRHKPAADRVIGGGTRRRVPLLAPANSRLRETQIIQK